MLVMIYGDGDHYYISNKKTSKCCHTEQLNLEGVCSECVIGA